MKVDILWTGGSLKVCRNFEISKMEFFNFFSTDRIKQNQTNLKTIRNLLRL